MPPRAGSRYVSPACPAPSPIATSSGAGRRSHTQSTGGRALIDPELLEENTALVEWPVAVAGHFDAAFLALPDAVLTETMQGHQRYFPVAGDDGALMPHFIAVSNIASRDVETVRKGNERVIRPRLSDAAYFFDADRRSISGSSGCFPRPVCGTLTVCATMRGRCHNRPIRFFNTEGPVRPDMESARLRGHLTLWGGGIHHAKNQDRRYPRCSHEICRQLP